MAFAKYDCSGRCVGAYKNGKLMEVTSKLPECHEDKKNPWIPDYKYKVDHEASLISNWTGKRPDIYSISFKKGYEQGVDDYDKCLTPIRIIYNPPATIVFWADGKKTVVKCSKTETFNKYHGFCAALAKRVVGNNSQLTKLVESGFVEGKLPDKCDTRVEPEKKKKSKETKKK